MKKLTFALLIMAIVVFAETSGVDAKADAVVDNYNSIVLNGWSNDMQTMCHVRNGLYMTYQGETYVIEVKYYTCHWYDETLKIGGPTKCLSHGSAYKSTRLCDCDKNGVVSCM